MAIATLVLSAIAAYAIYQLACRYHHLQRNIALAKSSGLPVVVTPWNVYNRCWLATYKLWTPLFRTFLPRRLQGLWIEYVCTVILVFMFLISAFQGHAARVGLHGWTRTL
jgi:hypothetical protein